ncbi:bifunctional DNA primase/polymerase [Paenibacillus pabuli]|uniref:Bifunctional DNA primase/polymerase-like protein n=2 Tax=Paenibacillus TaxID=44249 RepID=A0A855Y6P1_9BACL|nr:bifunctional DNA primase/polymerase [Paenibacillus pabuli]PWW37877.1 bifunctional DNA primase/polymerase-like protein [Paenibacillus pabuli]PXW08104.1 bifunctional DNA primase/polymerase-like protein [Paenibacillus taichungensis]
MVPNQNNLLKAKVLNKMTVHQAVSALSHANPGLRFIPLCPADHHGVNEKHKKKCSKPGKVPLLAKWPQKASNDPTTLENWFKGCDNLNLGMTTGGISGVIGFDIDGHYGQTKMERLFCSSIPLTWQFSTPGGGSRYLFCIPEGEKLRKLTDVNSKAQHEELALLADGQMTVMPPSRHHNGGKYLWIEGRGPGDIPLANLPENVLIQLRKGSLKLTNEEQNIPIITLGSSLLEASPPDHLKTLSVKCKVIDEAVTQQSLDGCDETHWHHIVSMLVRSGYTETALAFSQMSTKHDTHSEKRIHQMDEEREHATYGSTRCTTFGCSKEQIKKCHGNLRMDSQTNESTNSPIALLSLDNSSSKKPSIQQYNALLKGNYGIHHNNLCQIKYKNDEEPEYKPLANFVARIYKSISKTNGEEKNIFYVLDGVLLKTKKRLSPIEIPAVEFERMNWVFNWGPEPNIYPGNGMRDKVRFVIQSTADMAKHEQVYTHLGWVKLNGQWSYLHANGALGFSNVKVELDSRLKNYALPEHVSNSKHAMEKSLELLNVAPHRITLALWGITFLSPLCEWLRQEGIEPKFLMWLYGYTGSRKTTLAKLFLSHFGNLLEHPPASFKDTSNSVEKRGFDAKDSLLLIDDYHPTSSLSEKKIMESLAQKVLRGYGDRVSRGRMKHDTSLRTDYLPRGMAIVTAEDMLSGGSSMARLFPVELKKTDIQLNLLTKAQLNSSALSEAMSGYVNWIGQAMNSSEKYNIKDLFINKRNEASHLGVHGRLIEASVWIYLGLQMGLDYAESIGAIANDQQEKLLKEAWDLFLNVAHEQGEQVTEIKSSTKFIKIVSQLLSNKTIYTRPIQENTKIDSIPINSSHVGWHDEKYFYMIPDVIYNQVYQFLSKQGETFPISASMLWRELIDSGLIQPEVEMDKGKKRIRHDKKKLTQDGRLRLLWLRRTATELQMNTNTSRGNKTSQSESYEIVDSIDDM